MNKYELAVSKLKTMLNAINDSSDYMIIYLIKSRIKTHESILEKFRRYSWTYSEDAIDVQLHDVAGVRVICPFLSDVYNVIDAIRANDSIRVITEKDYIKNKKPTGYAGYHMIVRVPVDIDGSVTYVKAEVQLRTIAMDIFNSLEHKLRYKKRELFQKSENDMLDSLAGTIHLIDANLDRFVVEQRGQVDSSLLKTVISGEVLPSHKSAMKCLKDFIEGVRSSYKSTGGLDPVEFVMPKYSLSNIYNMTHGSDVSLNVICSFLSDVDEMVNCIRASEDFMIVGEFDYRKSPEYLGKSEYVFFVRVPVVENGVCSFVDARINVKTIIMDFCGIVEYILTNGVGLAEDVVMQLTTTSYSLRMIESEFAYLASTIFARKRALVKPNDEVVNDD